MPKHHVLKESKSFRAIVKRTEEEQRRQRSTSPFVNTGMHPNGSGGMDSDNFVPGVSGYSFADDGNAEFNDLTLRGGIIGNDALTEPVRYQVARASASNFSLTVAWDEKAGVNVTVPTGFSQAHISVNARMYAVNPNTTGGADGSGTDAWYVRGTVTGGSTTTSTPTGVSGSNGFATTVSFDAFTLTGLTGGATIRVGVDGSTGYQSAAAHSSNYANVVATIAWLR